MKTKPPGPSARTFWTRFDHSTAPMGQTRTAPEEVAAKEARRRGAATVLASGTGSNLFDVDGNRYVDLAAGFGAVLLGHGEERLAKVLELQAARLLQGLGDVYPSDAKIALSERLARLLPNTKAKVILGLSGADAVSAALKTAVLFSGRPGVLAFRGGYHGLSYGPLAVSDFRASYRSPFLAQLNPHVGFVDYPRSGAEVDAVLAEVDRELRTGRYGAVLVEPILGRGGVVVPPAGFLGELASRARARGAVLIADEIWTGLGRSGSWLHSVADGATPDLVCLGKGLGGGLPLSACVGRDEVMAAWRGEDEIVHTSTFAGAPLAAALGVALLERLEHTRAIERAARVGAAWLGELKATLAHVPGVVAVRGAGLMIGIELYGAGSAARLFESLLEAGYVVTTGGKKREVLVLTPALTIDESLLAGFVPVIEERLRALRRA